MTFRHRCALDAHPVQIGSPFSLFVVKKQNRAKPKPRPGSQLTHQIRPDITGPEDKGSSPQVRRGTSVETSPQQHPGHSQSADPAERENAVDE